MADLSLSTTGVEHNRSSDWPRPEQSIKRHLTLGQHLPANRHRLAAVAEQCRAMRDFGERDAPLRRTSEFLIPASTAGGVQSSRRGTLASTSAAISSGLASVTGYERDHNAEPSATDTSFTLRIFARSSTAP